MITKITNSDLKILLRLYKIDWPKHLVTYGLLEHFIDRFEKLPQWQDKVQFLKLEDSPINNGTFAFINGPHIYFDTLAAPPFDELKVLNNQLDYGHEKVFIGVRDVFRPILEELIRVQNLEKTFDTGTRCILTVVPPEIRDEMESVAMSKLPKGFSVDSLKESDVELINSSWAGIHKGSEDFLKTAIRMNPSTGIYTDNGELIAWCTFLETGAAGNLQVVDKYKRHEFGTIVALIQCMKILRMGRNYFAHIVHQNDISFHMATKEVFIKWIGNNSWIGVKKREKTALAPLWGHL